MDRESSVGITTRYGLDGSGGRIPVGARFSEPVKTGPVPPPQPPIRWVPGLSWGGRAAEVGIDLPTPSSAEVKERVELYSPCGS